MSDARPCADKISRREVLKATAAAGAACFMPTYVPGKALGRDGAVAPSERIVMGAIGIGARGEFDLGWMLREKDVQFVAICDARKVRREAVKQIIDKHHGTPIARCIPRSASLLRLAATSTRC